MRTERGERHAAPRRVIQVDRRELTAAGRAEGAPNYRAACGSGKLHAPFRISGFGR